MLLDMSEVIVSKKSSQDWNPDILSFGDGFYLTYLLSHQSGGKR